MPNLFPGHYLRRCLNQALVSLALLICLYAYVPFHRKKDANSILFVTVTNSNASL